MVDVLWTADNAAGAMELEDLWNALQRRLGFELLCGFSARGLSGGRAPDVEAFRSRHGFVSGFCGTAS
jgi:hypothetical protein